MTDLSLLVYSNTSVVITRLNGCIFFPLLTLLLLACIFLHFHQTQSIYWTYLIKCTYVRTFYKTYNPYYVFILTFC